MNKKEDLTKLLKLIEEISGQPGNEWFRVSLNHIVQLNNSIHISSPQLQQIYEHCIRKIMIEHAQKFYSDFKLSEIKSKLVDDFIRMEKFRRDSNFEDFCLALYQQLELIINELWKSEKFVNYLLDNMEKPAILKYNKEKKIFLRVFERHSDSSIGQLIFQTSAKEQVNKLFDKWHFTKKFRAVLYHYYYNNELKINTENFEAIYKVAYYLFQARHLNHRGDINKTEKQMKIINEIIPNQHKYYFKFLGFLEDFITTINKNI